MDRRSFFKSMIGGVAAAAAVRTFPFRVFSFPEKIVVPRLLLSVGDVVQFDQVFHVNPRTGKELPILKSFVVTQDVFARGSEDIEIPIHPHLYRDGVYRNCVAPENFRPKIQNFFAVSGLRTMPTADFDAMYPESATRCQSQSR